jgi:hypothetical protein
MWKNTVERNTLTRPNDNKNKEAKHNGANGIIIPFFHGRLRNSTPLGNIFLKLCHLFVSEPLGCRLHD